MSEPTVPTSANIPASFVTPKELWILVDPETGGPCQADIRDSYYVCFDLKTAYAAARTYCMDNDIYAVPIRVF